LITFSQTGELSKIPILTSYIRHRVIFMIFNAYHIETCHKVCIKGINSIGLPLNNSFWYQVKGWPTSCGSEGARIWWQPQELTQRYGCSHWRCGKSKIH
jgi:hypothetical protein